MSHACQRHLYLIVLVDISELDIEASCIPVHLDSWASTYIGHIEVALSHVTFTIGPEIKPGPEYRGRRDKVALGKHGHVTVIFQLAPVAVLKLTGGFRLIIFIRSIMIPVLKRGTLVIKACISKMFDERLYPRKGTKARWSSKEVIG
ncbi:hypothetical protein EV363DRAFT_1300133 [Boletus edulis]|nr:hypothetical protein EV363DRAFT_1300133 [Boletus edulis]